MIEKTQESLRLVKDVKSKKCRIPFRIKWGGLPAFFRLLHLPSLVEER